MSSGVLGFPPSLKSASVSSSFVYTHLEGKVRRKGREKKEKGKGKERKTELEASCKRVRSIHGIFQKEEERVGLSLLFPACGNLRKEEKRKREKKNRKREEGAARQAVYTRASEKYLPLIRLIPCMCPGGEGEEKERRLSWN